GMQARSELHDGRIEVKKLRTVVVNQTLGFFRPFGQKMLRADTVPTGEIALSEEPIWRNASQKQIRRPAAALRNLKQIARWHPVHASDPAEVLDAVKQRTVDFMPAVKHSNAPLDAGGLHLTNESQVFRWAAAPQIDIDAVFEAGDS